MGDLIIGIDFRKEYFEIVWASMRASVEPSFAERTLINHVDYLPKARIIISTATNITENEVTTADGQCVGFDYLVIATGHAGGPEFTRSEKLQYYQGGKQLEAPEKINHYLLFIPYRVKVGMHWS